MRAAALPRVRAFFGMTLLPQNSDRVDETVEAARACVPGLRARDFHFNVGMQSGHYYRNLDTDARPPARVLDVLKRHRHGTWDPVSFLERAYQKRVPQFLETGRSPVPCAALRASAFIDAQGTVYPCSIYSRPLGSLREANYDLGAVLSGAEARAARASVVADTCPGCWTPCEAYQSLFAAYARPFRRREREPETEGLGRGVQARADDLPF